MKALRSLHPNVWVLGATSFFTDIATEMTAAVMPVYLAVQLGLSPAIVGTLDGLHFGAAGLTVLLGGFLADRTRAYKQVALFGYITSLVSKGLLFVFGTAGMIGAAIGLDRLGKGLRTAPRDAMIGLSSEPERVANAFGVHRMLDTGGAALGPVAAFLILNASGDDYRGVFAAALAAAAFGALILALLGTNPVAPQRPVLDSPRSSVWPISFDRKVSRLMLAVVPLALTTVSDGLLYLVLQQKFGLETSEVIKIFVVASLSYCFFAWPAGLAADALGRRSVFVAGYLAYFVAYVVALSGLFAGVTVISVPLLVGLYYACTEGVLAGIVTNLTSPEQRARGLATVAFAVACARFAASVIFGLIWASSTTFTALVFFAASLMLAIALSIPVLRTIERQGSLENT